MKVFDVKILNYNKESNSYTVQYCVNVQPGVVRRTKAVYDASFKGLSRDYDGKNSSDVFVKVREVVQKYEDTQRV